MTLPTLLPHALGTCRWPGCLAPSRVWCHTHARRLLRLGLPRDVEPEAAEMAWTHHRAFAIRIGRRRRDRASLGVAPLLARLEATAAERMERARMRLGMSAGCS